MKSGILSLVAGLVMTGPALGAKKFWEKMPSREWSREQVSKILTKSPWAHQFHISQSKLQKLYPSTDFESQVRASRGFSRNPANVVVTQGLERDFDNTGGDFGSFIPLIVRWETAPPVKWAWARYHELAGLKTKTGEDQWSGEGAEYAVVSISGLPPANIPREPTEQTRFLDGIKAQSYLKIKNKAPWRPNGGKLGKQQRRVALYILFPRERARAVDLRDQTIEFVTRISDQKISRKFKLKDMVFDGTPAL